MWRQALTLEIPSPTDTPFNWEAVQSTPVGTPYGEISGRTIRRVDLHDATLEEITNLMLDIAERLVSLMEEHVDSIRNRIEE